MKSVLKKIINYLNSMDPAKVMVIGFASVVLLGALLLNLPIATKSGESIGLLDALFTATSAVKGKAFNSRIFKSKRLIWFG